MRLPELAPGHDQAGEKEGARRANMFHSVKNRIEETDERVEAKEEAVIMTRENQDERQCQCLSVEVIEVLARL